MTEAIRLLRIEHHQANAMLKSIEEQIESAAGIDLALMQSIADYFADYPDQCHHPVEDVVFRRMEKRDPARAAAVVEILSDHRKISEITGKLVAAVEKASNDGDQDGLRSVMREFVDQYRSHIDSEERDFFPLALEMLRDDDWAEVGYEVFDSQDPLYNLDVEERFRRLRDDIDKRAANSIRRGIFTREAQVLQQLDSIAAFNVEMARTGQDYRLLEHTEGGFGLEKDGNIVIDIPKCSPARAAWCAYFFVAGSSGKV
jgi:hemerythrin-like domain-containing protein